MGKNISRRETLKRGAAFGGALLWSVPVVQTLDMTHAFAALPSGPTPGPDISFIGLNVRCGPEPTASAYVIKYEGCEDGNCFEAEPGRFPKCGFFVAQGQKSDGDSLGFTIKGPHEISRCVEISVPTGCRVIGSAIKGGQVCCPGATGTGDLVFCPPSCF